MNRFTWKFLPLFFAALTYAEAGVRGVMSSHFLARGEQVVFEIRVEGQDPDRMPAIPQIKDVEMESIGFGQPRMVPGRRVESSFQYAVTSYTLGKHEIPAIEVMVNGTAISTKPVAFEVFDPDELKWQEVASTPAGASDVIRYASIIKIPQKKYFENQSMEAEIKIFVPLDLARTVDDWGVPQFERKGLAVWRFEPSESRGQVNLLGQPYATLSYPTTMTAIASGVVEIGPATVRLTYGKMIFDRFAQRVEVEATLDVAKFVFETQALPEGAPEGFDNAVGDFTIGTAIKQTEVTEGEPLAVDVIVSGSGNLDNLRTPKLVDESGWKVYDATPVQRGDERRNISGTVVFSQFIRPLEMKTGIPPFRLVFFNPTTETYQTVMTDAIPLKMSAALGGRNFESSGPPQAMPLPLEKMTDILGLMDSGALLSNARNGLPIWLGHAAAGLLSLALIARALWIRFAHVFEKDHEKIRRRKDFSAVSTAAATDGMNFLKVAGAFVEKWLSPEKDGDLRQILEERDQLCFRASKDDVVLPQSRRNEILRSLKRAAFCFVITAISAFSIPNANAQDVSAQAKEAYESAKYEEAAGLWLGAGSYENLSADTLYNIGNAAYRMGAPGQAALYYRRALVSDPTHEESRQNLRFIERKFGSISIVRPNYQYVLARIPLSTWKAILWTGVWLLVVGLLIFPATRSGSGWRIAGLVGFVLGPLLLAISSLAWFHFPNDADFAPLAKQAVIVGPSVVLHTDAARTSPEVIDAPQGSLAEVLQNTGRWAYIRFATKTRGWVPVESIEMVLPKSKPEPPKVKKSTADGSSA